MRMATNVRYWTRADLEHLPDDGNRYEVLDGVLLVTPQASYGHQYVATRIAAALLVWCDRYRIGFVVGPGAVPVGESELQPDVQVVPYGRYPSSVKWDELPLPLLVVEVRSDSTYRRDIGIKRAAYQRFEIPEYWVVDPDARRALVWTPTSDEPVIVGDVLRWHPRSDIAALEITLNEILTPAR
jgi:Uma2 family endonuclease